MFVVLEYKRRFYFLLLAEIVLTVYVALKKSFYRFFKAKPTYNTWWYDRLSACKIIRETAEKSQTALSLNVVYNYNFQGCATNFDQWLERLWMNMPSAQAVRNRKTIVTSLFDAEVRRIWQSRSGKKIAVAFLAGGFVETGIAVAVRARKDGILMNCVVLDMSSKALDYAAERAANAGVRDMFTFIRINLLDTEKVQAYLSGLNVEVIEMIGILDYLTNADAVQLFRIVKASMAPDGLMLTGNILPGCLESPFLYTVINWPKMRHRNHKQFSHLLYEAGFITESDQIELHIEPHKVFMVLEVRNPASYPLELMGSHEPKGESVSVKVQVAS